jgi:SulP family sulfate permease
MVEEEGDDEEGAGAGGRHHKRHSVPLRIVKSLTSSLPSPMSEPGDRRELRHAAHRRHGDGRASPSTHRRGSHDRHAHTSSGSHAGSHGGSHGGSHAHRRHHSIRSGSTDSHGVRAASGDGAAGRTTAVSTLVPTGSDGEESEEDTFDSSSIRPYPLQHYWENREQVKNEVLAGLTVGFAQVTESIAFAFLAGLPPDKGMNACWIVGLTVALFGSRPGIVDGATGAAAAVLAPTILEYGVEYLPYIILLGGLFELLAAGLKSAKLVRLIPITAMAGFTNGLALLVFIAQFRSFQYSSFQFPEIGDGVWLWERVEGTPEDWNLQAMVGLMCVHVVLSMFLVHFFPKVTKVVPSSLIAILAGVGLEYLIRATSDFHTPRVAEFSDLSGGLPSVFWKDERYPLPPLNGETFGIVIGPALAFAAVIIVEELLTMQMVDEITDTKTTAPDQQIAVLGVASLVSGFFGTMSGGATVGPTVVLLHSGASGRYRIALATSAIFVFLVTAVLADVVAVVPTSTLVGIMLIVVRKTFNWGTLPIIAAAFLPKSLRNRFSLHRKIHRSDAVVIVVVTVVTLIIDLAVAILIGVVLSAFQFAWTASTKLTVESEMVSAPERLYKRRGSTAKAIRVYHVSGPLYFGSIGELAGFFDVKHDPEDVEVHFREAQIYDFSAVQALMRLGEKYDAAGKRLHLRHLNTESTKLIAKADHLIRSFSYDIVERLEDGELEHQKPFQLGIQGNFSEPV